MDDTEPMALAPEPFTVLEEWNMSIIDQMISIHGRLNRLRYLGISILLFFSSFFYGLIAGFLLSLFVGISGLPWLLFELGAGVLLIPVWYCYYAITVKRLQDMNWGNGWTTYLQAYTFLLAIWGFVPYGSAVLIILDIATFVLAIPLIVTVFAPGDSGSNQFGPDPLITLQRVGL